MGSFVALGVGLGLGIAAYKNMYPVARPMWNVILFVWVVAMLAAWVGGRRNAMSQLQFQIQNQEQAQEQTQQQAVVIQVLDREQAAQLAGGVPALAGDPAISALPPFSQVGESEGEVIPVLRDHVPVAEVTTDSIDRGLTANSISDWYPELPNERDSVTQKSDGDDT